MIVRQEPAALTRPPYELGAPISLADLLALPPDGFHYTRDAEGRLALMSPDDKDKHRLPLACLTRALNRRLENPWWVVHEGAVAFPRVWDLAGNVLPDSFLGPKAVTPDVAVFSQRPGSVVGPHGLSFCAPEHLVLAIELLSPGTWQSDLGIGECAGEVDRPRTYLAGGVRELWVLNPAVDDARCPVAPRRGRFLRRGDDGTRWVELALTEGVVKSLAVPGLELDLASFWRDSGL